MSGRNCQIDRLLRGTDSALGLYAAAFIAVHNDIDPFMRAIPSAERRSGVGRRHSLYRCRFLGHRLIKF
jgi:hypothetical protein